jgi:uncharacterized membrane protein YeaQ/YmgE (transglycosylase-associated protein family)
MVIFAIATWILFGLTIGGMVSFFMERWGHTYEHLIAGVGGAFVGGVLGLLLGNFVPALSWEERGYSVTSLITSLIFSIAFTLIERRMHRRGRVLLSDPRPDVP